MSKLVLSHVPILESLHVYLNGVEMEAGVDWSLLSSPPRIDLLSPAALKSADLVEARYAYSDPTTYTPSHVITPYSPSSPARGASTAPLFVPYGTPCAGSAHFWEPDGYGPFSASLPGNTTPVPGQKEADGWTFAGGGLGGNSSAFDWVAPTAPGGPYPNFGDFYGYAYDLATGCAATVTVTGGSFSSYDIPGATHHVTMSSPAGSAIYRILFYAAYAGNNVQFDLGYNPFI